MSKNKHKKRFAFGMLALALAALACRNQPEPNSPLPKIEKPSDDDAAKSGPPSPLKRDAGG